MGNLLHSGDAQILKYKEHSCDANEEECIIPTALRGLAVEDK